MLILSFFCYVSLQSYNEYWGVLLRSSASSPNRIELYWKNESDALSTNDQHHVYEFENPTMVIEFNNVLYVKPMELKEKATFYEFCVIAVNAKHHFAARGAEECRSWVKKLNRQLFGPPEDGVLCKPVYIIAHSLILQPSRLDQTW